MLTSLLRYKGVPAYPITVSSARRWGATFKAGKTYGLYVNRLKMADLLLGNDPEWHTAEIKTATKGLINAQEKRFAFTYFVQSSDLFRIMDRENNSALARVEYMSYLFPLRVHSGTLQLIRAASKEPLLMFVPQGPKVFIGSQTFEKAQVMVIKSKYRKTFAQDSHYFPPCLRNEPKLAAMALCPPHFWWKLICDSIRVGPPPIPQDRRELRQPANQSGGGEIRIR